MLFYYYNFKVIIFVQECVSEYQVLIIYFLNIVNYNKVNKSIVSVLILECIYFSESILEFSRVLWNVMLLCQSELGNLVYDRMVGNICVYVNL